MKTTLFGSAILASAYSLLILFIFAPKLSKNVMALGPTSSVANEISIPLYQPVDLGALSLNEIINLRSGIVSKNRELLARQYTPTGVVFNKIKDRIPWLSTKGFFYYGYLPSAVVGLSKEARNILNPYLLVSAEFVSLSAWSASNLKWDKDRITDKDLSSPDFPLYCKAQSLTWNPRLLKAEVTYPVSAHIDALRKWIKQPLDSDALNFALVDYNARDLGFTHMAVDAKASTGLANPEVILNPIELKTHLAPVYEACSPGLECNNIAGQNDLLNKLVIKKLPARVVVKLWRGAPNSPDAPVNMRFDIVLH